MYTASPLWHVTKVFPVWPSHTGPNPNASLFPLALASRMQFPEVIARIGEMSVAEGEMSVAEQVLVQSNWPERSSRRTYPVAVRGFAPVSTEKCVTRATSWFG